MSYKNISASSILHPSIKKAIRRQSHKITGYMTPQGRAYCAECATSSIKSSAVETFYTDSLSDWNITCYDCSEDIVEREEED